MWTSRGGYSRVYAPSLMLQVAGQSVGCSLRRANIKLQRRASTIAHIYPSVLQALSGWGCAGCLKGWFQGYRGGAIQDPASELPRIHIPRNPVNKGKKKGQSVLAPALPLGIRLASTGGPTGS
jgi:hypothetical protein